MSDKYIAKMDIDDKDVLIQLLLQKINKLEISKNYYKQFYIKHIKLNSKKVQFSPVS